MWGAPQWKRLKSTGSEHFRFNEKVKDQSFFRLELVIIEPATYRALKKRGSSRKGLTRKSKTNSETHAFYPSRGKTPSESPEKSSAWSLPTHASRAVLGFSKMLVA